MFDGIPTEIDPNLIPSGTKFTGFTVDSGRFKFNSNAREVRAGSIGIRFPAERIDPTRVPSRAHGSSVPAVSDDSSVASRNSRVIRGQSVAVRAESRIPALRNPLINGGQPRH